MPSYIVRVYHIWSVMVHGSKIQYYLVIIRKKNRGFHRPVNAGKNFGIGKGKSSK